MNRAALDAQRGDGAGADRDGVHGVVDVDLRGVPAHRRRHDPDPHVDGVRDVDLAPHRVADVGGIPRIGREGVRRGAARRRRPAEEDVEVLVGLVPEAAREADVDDEARRRARGREALEDQLAGVTEGERLLVLVVADVGALRD